MGYLYFRTKATFQYHLDEGKNHIWKDGFSGFGHGFRIEDLKLLTFHLTPDARLSLNKTIDYTDKSLDLFYFSKLLPLDVNYEKR